MKKKLITALFLALLLAACGNPAPAESPVTEAPTTEAPTTEASTTEATEEATMPTVSAEQRMEEVRPLYYGTSEQMPDRTAAVAILEELADEDLPEVNYLLALDAYIRNDYEKALPLCEKAVDQNFEPARVLLGEMYLKVDIATPRDAEKAEALFRQAIDNGCSDGHIGLGDIYQMGSLGKINLLKAADEFKIAAEEGTDPYWISYAYGSLGVVYSNKYAIFEDFLEYDVDFGDFEAAVASYEQAAKLWDYSAMYNLAALYKRGLDLSYLSYDGSAVEGGVEPNPEQAKECAEKLIAVAEQTEDAEACWFAGSLYHYGNGVEQNFEKALEWFQKGAALGSADCMNLVGVYYYNGLVWEADPEKEIEWYLKAAEAGNTLAMRNIAVSYYNGDSLEQNDDKAVEWHEKAAAYGDNTAMIDLADSYWYREDYEKYVEWTEKAAANGSSNAMNKLGLYFFNNEDYEKAEEWWRKAANMQNTDGMVNLAKLIGHIAVLSGHYDHTAVQQSVLAEMAWKLGSGYAMQYIGESFEKQIFYGMNRNQAITFYKLAVDAGYKKAQDDLKRLGVTYNP